MSKPSALSSPKRLKRNQTFGIVLNYGERFPKDGRKTKGDVIKVNANQDERRLKKFKDERILFPESYSKQAINSCPSFNEDRKFILVYYNLRGL